jgi:signal peptidase II
MNDPSAAGTSARSTAIPSAVRWLWLAVLVVALDQASKAWIVAHFELYQTQTITVFLEIIRTHNTGAAFSFLAGASGWQRWLFIGLGIAVSVGVPVWLRVASPGPLVAAGLSLIVGGALGNVIDRVWQGHVIDFLHVHYRGFDFPAFNVADSAITVGAAFLILDVLLDMRRRPQPPAARGAR